MNINYAIEILNRGYLLDDDSNKIPLTSNIDIDESDFLFDFICNDKTIKNILEIGCGHGISSLTISSALNNRNDSKHTILDPLQKSLFDDLGVKSLADNGFSKINFLYERSEKVLPNLTAGYDLIFIDGWHTFDQVIIDLFYSFELLKIGGYVIIDDADFRSVGKAISYYLKCPNISYVQGIKRDIKFVSLKRKIGMIIRSVLSEKFAQFILPKILFDNYFYTLSPTMVILKKNNIDNRPWNFHEIF